MSMNAFDLMKIQKLIENITIPLYAEIDKLKSVNVDLASHITNNIKSKTDFNFDDHNISKLIYSNQDHANKKYVRNPKLWINGIDLTAISPWNSSGGGNRAGTAITPRHIIYASHYKIPVGATVRFVTNDNEVVERNVVNIQSISSTDITIGTLDSNLPSTIKPVKFLPPDWSKYMAFDKNLKYGENAYLLKPRIPALCLDQEEKALIADVMGFTGGQATFTLPADVKMRQFNEQIVVGDSGNPSFFIIDNELVLITVWTFGGYGSGNFVSGVVYDTSTKTTKSVLKEINNLVLYVYGSSSTDLYTLDVVDLWKYRTV